MMKFVERFFLWCLILAALAGLFYAQGRPGLSPDAGTPLRLLTDEGVKTMTMAQYLPLAVAAEMPASFEPEALRAQAVAARTFALACRAHASDGADVCSRSGCCIAFAEEDGLRAAWGPDYDGYMAKLEQAVADTDGEYLVYDGAPIQAVFHASSLHQTEDSGNLWSPLPYLVSVVTPEQPRDVPGLVTQVKMTAQELAGALGLGGQGDPAGWLEGLQNDGAGRVQSLTVCGQTFSGQQARALLGLRSTAFSVQWQDGVFLFTVSGYGHGVGMSQYGAQTYALRGLDYRAILAHYYPGAALTAYSPAGPSAAEV